MKRRPIKDKWRGLRRFSVYLGVFDYAVRVVIGPQELAIRYIRWYHRTPGLLQEDPTFTSRRGLCVHRDTYCPVIWIPRRPRTPREYATLAHEAFHAVGHVTRWAAITHGEATEEVFCHALGCIVNGVLAG